MHIEVDPIGKPRMTRSDRWKQRPAVMKYWAFKDTIKQATMGLETSGIVNLIFYIPFPKSYSKTKREKLLGKPHTLRLDIDNIQKGIFDSLFDNDGVIHTVFAKKVWAEKGGITIEFVKE